MFRIIKLLVPITLTVTLSGCLNTRFASVSSQDKQWSGQSLSKISDLLTGSLDSTLLGSQKSIWVDMASRKLVLSIPAPNVFISNWSTTVPELPGTELRAYVDSHDRSYVEVRYPLYLLIEKLELNNQKFGLPNGDPLPGIPQGKLPKVDIPMLNNFRAHLFVGEGVVALLVDVPYDPVLKTSLPIKSKSKNSDSENILGYANTVPKENLEYGGLFISAVIPAAAMALLGQ